MDVQMWIGLIVSHLLAFAVIGMVIAWLLRMKRRPVGAGDQRWTLESHKTNPRDRTGKRWSGPDAMWPDTEKNIHTHEEIMAMHRHRRLPPASA